MIYRSIYVPRWYLTSPEPSSAASNPANWLNICISGLRHTLANTLSRPLCANAMIMLSTPKSVLLSMICFMAGIKISHPSTPNLFSEVYFFDRKASNL